MIMLRAEILIMVKKDGKLVVSMYAPGFYAVMKRHSCIGYYVKVPFLRKQKSFNIKLEHQAYS